MFVLVAIANTKGVVLMYKVVVCLGDKPGFIKVEEDNLIVIPDIQASSKFEDIGEEHYRVLLKARESFPNLQFVVASCPSLIFGKKPRNVIREEVILNNAYFCSNSC